MDNVLIFAPENQSPREREQKNNSPSLPDRKSLFDAAVTYASRGWPVLLLAENGKAPLVIPQLQEHAWRDATTDVAELERRFSTARRIGGIGIVTGKADNDPGIGPVVLDLDGPCAKAWGLERFGNDIPRVETRKGAHLYFAPEPELGRRIKIAAQGFSCTCGGECGIDLLATGGYAAAPPSIGKAWVGALPTTLPPLPDDLRSTATSHTPMTGPRPWEQEDVVVGAGVKRVLAALATHNIPARQRRGALKWEFCCPSHDDQHASAAVGQGPKGAWVNCQAGCSTQAILTKLGLRQSDLRDDLDRGPRGGGGGAPLAYQSARDERDRHIRELVDEAIALAPTPSSGITLDEAEAQLSDVISNPPSHLSLVQVTTGVGKTTTGTKVYTSPNNDKYLTAVVDTQERAWILEKQWQDELLKRLSPRDALNSTHVHIGRREPTESEWDEINATVGDWRGDQYWTPQGVCLLQPYIERVAEHRHLAISVCMNCPHGKVMMLNKARRGQDHANIRRLETELLADGVKIEETVQCGALWQFEVEQKKPLVAVAGTAIAPSQVEAPQGIERDLLIDEITQLTDQVVVSSRTIDEWIEHIAGRTAWLAERVEQARDGNSLFLEERESALAAWQEMSDEVIPALLELRDVLISPAGQQPSIDVLHGKINKVGELAVRYADDRNTAEWEKVFTQWEGRELHELRVALRGAVDLYDAAQRGNVVLHKRNQQQTITWEIVGFAPNALWQTVLTRHDKGQQVTIMDATPPLGVREAIERLNGCVTHVTVDQPARVLCDPSHVLGRGERKRQNQRQEQGVDLILTTRRMLADQLECKETDIVVLTHKPWAEAGSKSGGQWGWWGRHERAHDLWRGAKALIIAGAPTLPPAGMKEQYLRDRAVVLSALQPGTPAPTEWPEWGDNEEMSIQQEIPVGGRTLRWPGQLPVDKHLRRWVLDRYAREYAQACGRLRAVRRSDHPVVLILGPCPDLSSYGIHVEYTRAAGRIVLGARPAERGAGWRAETELGVVDAMIGIQIEAKNQQHVLLYPEKITVREIREWRVTHGLPAPHSRAIRRVKDKIRGGRATCFKKIF